MLRALIAWTRIDWVVNPPVVGVIDMPDGWPNFSGYITPPSLPPSPVYITPPSYPPSLVCITPPSLPPSSVYVTCSQLPINCFISIYQHHYSSCHTESSTTYQINTSCHRQVTVNTIVGEFSSIGTACKMVPSLIAYNSLLKSAEGQYYY